MRDDTPTLLAAGVLAYVAETMLHEAAGHGGVCLAEGHRLLALAPLWMRCSETGWLLTAAGPAANVIAAVVFFGLLRVMRNVGPAAGLLLWLGFAFNALVACGYLGVGAATGFGDWPVLFAGVAPSASWRVPALLVAICGYYGCLHVAARLFVSLAGGGPEAARDLRRRALVPAAGAAFVACLAEIVGQRADLMTLALSLGCTAVIGWSLSGMDGVIARARLRNPAHIVRTPSIIVSAAVVAAIFIIVVGPVYRPS